MFVTLAPVASTMRANPKLDTEKAITELGVGEALVPSHDEKGRPIILERAFILPPASRIGPITPEERKALMAELADGFVALPGGLGTVEEFFEVLTWAQLGIHSKPCALLDVAGYWRPLIRLLDHAVEERFLRPDHRRLLLVERGPERLLDRLVRWRPPPHLRRWIDRRAS